jgi:peroxiredoxin
VKIVPFLLFVVCPFSLWAQEGVVLGQKVPPFSLQNYDGQVWSLEKFAEGTVVLEWINPDCPFVVRHYRQNTMTDLAKAFPEVAWAAVNSTHYMTAGDSRAWAEKHQVSYPILSDFDGKVGLQFAAKTTPHMFIIHRGILIFDGPIDNDPRGSMESSAVINHVRQVLSALKEGQVPEPLKAKPYGCSVKYKP